MKVLTQITAVLIWYSSDNSRLRKRHQNWVAHSEIVIPALTRDNTTPQLPRARKHFSMQTPAIRKREALAGISPGNAFAHSSCNVKFSQNIQTKKKKKDCPKKVLGTQELDWCDWCECSLTLLVKQPSSTHPHPADKLQSLSKHV